MGESGGAQEHVLFFHDVAGAAHVERLPSLATAVQRVEQLANDEGVDDCELFALDPVRLQRQQRWHVAVAADSRVPAPRSAAPTAPSAVPPAQAAPEHADALDVEVVDEVFHEVVRAVADSVTTDSATAAGPPTEAPEPADVLPSSPRGRGLGFFVHQ